MKKRRILVVTGIRSEYDILYSTLTAINRHPKLELKVVVTGTHLASTYGETIHQIEADGFEIADRVESLLGSDTLAGRAKSVGIQIMGLTQAFSRLKPDMVMVLGDREEAITTAITAAYMNIPLVHLCGGDRTTSGIVDESIRHATTKLAHLHLTMTNTHKERIIRMGEQPWRVHEVGHGGLDRLISTPHLTRAELSTRLKIDMTKRPIGVVIHHNITNQISESADQMRVTLESAAAAGLTAAIIYPNSDVGSQAMIKEIVKFKTRMPTWGIFPNLPRLEFVNLLRHADVLVGNSTCGITEAPLLGLPVVNVGLRQFGREIADNIVFAPYNKREIVSAIHHVLTDRRFRRKLARKRSPYGDGRTDSQIAKILSTVELGPKLLLKDITY